MLSVPKRLPPFAFGCVFEQWPTVANITTIKRTTGRSVVKVEEPSIGIDCHGVAKRLDRTPSTLK